MFTIIILILFYGARGGSTCKFTLHPPTARINRSKIERHQRLIAKTREKHTKNTRKRAKTREKTRKTREKHANRPAIKRKTRKAPDKNSENNRKTRNSCHFYKNHILKGSPALAPKIAESLLFFKLASGRHTTQKITCRGS